ncbi:MAG TPA: trypsin-like peptidase domain-containing protein [Chthonomonadaceae bacterium]|nr:trypsin-like peptidase domain-containing protein [Chthonomonadaceae bacterium]
MRVWIWPMGPHDTLKKRTGIRQNARIGATYGLALLLGAAALSPGYAQEAGAPPGHTTNAALVDLQDAFTNIADQLEPVVVTVLSAKAYHGIQDEKSDIPRGLNPFRRIPHRSVGTGSGVIISKDGWILTNDHVVDEADKVTVRLHDGREFDGKVIADYRSDLALIKVDSPTPLPAARLGDSDKVRIGQWAIAIGSPYRYEGSFSVGVVSSLNRRQNIDMPGEQRFYPNMIQTDAAINPGNSGGPLCNIDGEVIAINTAIESEGGGSIGIGFAIPINVAKFVVAQLRAKGKVSYGYLGVDPTSVTPRTATVLKVDDGALIDAEPAETTPAAKAGLHAGDVVTGINGKPVHNELDLRTIVAQTPPGTTVTLAVVHEGLPRALKATLTEAPDTHASESSHPGAKTPSRLGIEVEPITKQMATEEHIPITTPGVAVKFIDPSTPAAEFKDLDEGVIILRVNDTDTPTVQAFQKATANLKSGDQVKILYQLRGMKYFIIIPVD